MRTAWIRALLPVAASVLLTTSVFAQGDNKLPPPDKWRCEGCISKVIELPSSSTPFEVQEVANTFRTIVDLRILSVDRSPTISVTCTPEQLVIAEKLVAVLEDLRSGGNRPPSILIYEPQGSQPADASSQAARKGRDEPELASSFIKAFYLPNSSPQQMQTLVNTLRTTAQITRTQLLASSHVVVVRGTSQQVAQAESLMNE